MWASGSQECICGLSQATASCAGYHRRRSNYYGALRRGGVLSLPNLESRDADVVASRCVIYLLRNSLRYASKRDWPALAKDFKPVFTAPTEAAARGPDGRLRRHLGSPLPGDRAAGGERHGPRALPDRAGRPQAPLPDDLQPRPRRPPAAAPDQPLEDRTERLRHHLRRTNPHQQGEQGCTVYSTALRWGTLQTRVADPSARGWRAGCFFGLDSRRDPGNGPGS